MDGWNERLRKSTGHGFDPSPKPGDYTGDESDARARNVEMEAACDEKQQALDELVPLVEELQAQVATLTAALRARDAECDEKRAALDELVPLVEELQARNAELEGRGGGDELAALCAAVLNLPAIRTKRVKLSSVKNLLLDRRHPEKFPNADDEGKAALNEATQAINAAYEALKRDKRG